jgi:hypothetical protein
MPRTISSTPHPTGGTYHPVGTAISTLTKVKLLPGEKFSLTAVNSAGSGANVQAMGAGTADFAILQGLFGSYAATGTGPITEPQENLRSVTMLWQNVEQFVMSLQKRSRPALSAIWLRSRAWLPAWAARTPAPSVQTGCLLVRAGHRYRYGF